MVAGVEIHDRWRGERDRATAAATTVERSPSVSPSVPLIFFFAQKSVRLEDISGGGLFCLVFIWQGNDVVPLSFFF